MVDRQFGAKVKVVRSDNGTEFFCLRDYFLQNGIVFQTSCVETPQQNGRVERKHRHILNVGRALRFQGNLPITFWSECILTAAFLINRTLSHVLNYKTPYELIYGHIPDYSDLRVFGSLCYAHDQRGKLDIFGRRSRKCVVLGYPYGKKGWKAYDLNTREYLVSRDVVFCETEFPYMNSLNGTVESHVHSNSMNGASECSNDDEIGVHTQDASPVLPRSNNNDSTCTLSSHILPLENGNVNTSTMSDTEEHELAEQGSGLSTYSPGDQPFLPQDENSGNVASVPQNMDHSTRTSGGDICDLGRGHRTKTQSVRLRDFVTNTVKIVSPSSGILYPIANSVNCNNFSVRHRHFLAALTAGTEPRSFTEAMGNPGWREAMSREIRALEDNGTWRLETLPPGKKALGSRWVYKIKLNSDGSRWDETHT
ncbi:hypothetical protein LIER_39533 [Lithospermum erythrorhizon]|uniref:Integrase catalytic domain-containing protein n=1 Tax=Lithospermum erythrorhizon TaxID=34254 RepID=A0AAV3QKC8_LITER